MIREIIVYPSFVDEKGTIHLRAMVKSKSKKYKAIMKRLAAIGIFTSKDTMTLIKDKE